MSGGLDVVRARVALRHRPLSDVLDLALRFCIVHWKPYAKVSLLTVLPGILFSWLVAWSSGWVLGWTVAIAWSLLAQTPFTVLASRLVFEDRVRARETLRAALADSPRVFVLRVLTLTAMSLGALLFLVPAAWVAVIFCFSTEVLLLERSTIGQTLSRSQRVAQSDIGESLFMVVLGLVFTAAAVLLAEMGGRTIIEDVLQFRAPPALWNEGGSVLALIGLHGIVPYLATARFFTYLNIRTRTEGWDIQTRFAALAARGDDAVKEAA